MTLPDIDPASRFTGLAGSYAAHRPTYPPEAIDFVVNRCSLAPGEVLIDVGCGTGISARIFAQRQLRVVGIEPNADMRAKAVDTPCSSCAFTPEYRDARAEATGLPDEYADAVVSAQAFHWFQPAAALAEFHRILKPARWAALIWNEREEADAFTRAYGDVIRTAPDALAQETRRAAAGQPLLDSDLFVERRRRAFRNSQSVDLPGLLGRAFSASYAPTDQDGRERWIESLTALFDDYQRHGMVRIEYETSVYVGRRR